MSDDSSRRDERLSRRHFCQLTGLAACTAAVGGATVLTADFLHPRALFEPSTRFVAGPPDAFDAGAVLTDQDHRAYVVRGPDGFRALSSVCTHLGCVTRYQPDQRVIACPCHGSRFSLDGEVLAGPAPRPLPQFQMALTTEGEIEVDTGIRVPEGTVFKL